MITTINNNNRLSFLTAGPRTLLIRHPEVWVWLLSVFGWTFLITDLSASSHNLKYSSSPVIYCAPLKKSPPEVHTTFKVQQLSSRVSATIQNKLLPWIIMVIAMMFPLLNRPVRHVAFSVRRKDSIPGIFSFLVGYMMAWIIVGLFLLQLPSAVDTLISSKAHFVNALKQSSVFFLAAAVVWLPSRPIRMIKCNQTMPIRIQGIQLYLDSLSYGWKMGFACMKICLLPMAALMLTHHNIVLMCILTIVLIYERYLLPHTSKLLGYIWTVIAFSLFTIEIMS